MNRLRGKQTCVCMCVPGMSGVSGAALWEVSCINRSLSALSDVLGALAEQRPHVPYRNSKLTHVLQDAIGVMHTHTHTHVLTFYMAHVSHVRFPLEGLVQTQCPHLAERFPYGDTHVNVHKLIRKNTQILYLSVPNIRDNNSLHLLKSNLLV